MLFDRTAQAFLDTTDKAYELDPLTSSTVVVPVPCGITPPAPRGWHAIRILQPGHDVWVNNGSDNDLQRSTRQYMVYHRCGTMPVPLRVSGGDSRLTLQFRGTVAGAPARILLDTGAAGCFANSAWCSKHGVAVKPHAGSAELPSGEVIHYDGKANLAVAIQGLNCHVSFNALQLSEDYDIILGDPWARSHNAVLDFGTPPSVRIPKRTKTHVLYPNGVMEKQLKPPPAPTLLTALQVKRMLRNGAQCIYGIVKRVPASHYIDAANPNHPTNRPDPRLSLDPDVCQLVDKFDDIFQDTPPGLP